MAKFNKTQCVKADLLNGERVDQDTVIFKYAAYRLSSIIGELRKAGMNIITLNPEGALKMGIITQHEFITHDSPKYGFYYMLPEERVRYIESRKINAVR